jgi:hypothetical protein
MREKRNDRVVGHVGLRICYFVVNIWNKLRVPK